MDIACNAALLRVFVGQNDTYKSLPLYEAIVLKAHEMRLAGATVLRAKAGFGHSSHIHTTKILRLAEDLPVVVEIVDTREAIDTFIPALDSMMLAGLVTIEKVLVLRNWTQSRSVFELDA